MAGKSKQQNKQTTYASKQTTKRKLLQTPEHKGKFTALHKKSAPTEYHSDLDETTSQLDVTDETITPVSITENDENEEIEEMQTQAQAQHSSDSNTKYISFMQSTEVDITDLINNQPIKFQDEFHKTFGQPLNIQIHRITHSIKITSQSLQQHQNILKTTSFFNIQVQVTENAQTTPQTTSHATKQPTLQKCIIFNVSLSINDQEIQESTKALQVKRIVAANKNLTHMVILSYADEELIPHSVKIGYLNFKTSLYIPRPIRCNKCQRFGHPTSACKSASNKCSYCAGAHTYDQCTTKRNNLPPHCSNCGAEHSAAFNRCPYYTQVKEALTIRAEERISYKEALTRVRPPSNSTANQSTSQTQSQTAQVADSLEIREQILQNKYDMQALTFQLKQQDQEIQELKATVASQTKLIETLTATLHEFQTTCKSNINSLFDKFTKNVLDHQNKANDLITNKIKDLMNTEIQNLKHELEIRIKSIHITPATSPPKLPESIIKKLEEEEKQKREQQRKEFNEKLRQLQQKYPKPAKMSSGDYYQHCKDFIHKSQDPIVDKNGLKKWFEEIVMCQQ